ncbi:MAG: alpha/beta hydrolase [Clostridia bacterium]|nr:alpha/beta hydrolase [Clostridia bacterium]
MKKGAKGLFIGAGITALTAAAASGVSYLITKTLVREALDRAEPKTIGKVKNKIMGDFAKREEVKKCADLAEKLKCDTSIYQVETTADDGTKLIGHIKECKNAKRIIIAMHGWRSSWVNDFCAIADFWHDSGATVLYCEQRGQGESGGDYMGFGMVERFDCKTWVNYVNENLSNGLPIYLAGVSMGATTVLMASSFEDLENVHGIMADCGFTSAKDIFKHVTEDNLHISYSIREPFVNALSKDRINLTVDGYSTIDALSVTDIPVLFVHGTDDTFVPVNMTFENYKACKSKKRLLIVPGADHGMSYLINKEAYEKAVLDFFKEFD